MKIDIYRSVMMQPVSTHEPTKTFPPSSSHFLVGTSLTIPWEGYEDGERWETNHLSTWLVLEDCCRRQLSNSAHRQTLQANNVSSVEIQQKQHSSAQDGGEVMMKWIYIDANANELMVKIGFELGQMESRTRVHVPRACFKSWLKIDTLLCIYTSQVWTGNAYDLWGRLLIRCSAVDDPVVLSIDYQWLSIDYQWLSAGEDDGGWLIKGEDLGLEKVTPHAPWSQPRAPFIHLLVFHLHCLRRKRNPLSISAVVDTLSILSSLGWSNEERNESISKGCWSMPSLGQIVTMGIRGSLLRRGSLIFRLLPPFGMQHHESWMRLPLLQVGGASQPESSREGSVTQKRLDASGSRCR